MSSLNFPAFDEFDLDENEQALCEYFLRMEFLAEKLESEVDDALLAWKRCTELEETLQGEFDEMVRESFQHIQIEEGAAGQPGRVSLPIIYTPGAAAAEVRIEALRLQAEAAAGALLLMLDEVMQRLRHSTKDSKTGQTPFPHYPAEFLVGAMGDNEHVSTLVYAAGNAYRHAKDWVGLVDGAGAVNTSHGDYKNARRTLEILRRSIDLRRVNHETACLACVERLTDGRDGSERSSFAVLWDRVNSVGRDYADVYSHGSESLEKVVSALDAQRQYADFRVSFSNDENLWREESRAESH